MSPETAIPEHLADDIARRFHEAYERLAPDFGYETRKESAVPWEDVPEPNRLLMRAVVADLFTEAHWEWDDRDLPVLYHPADGELPDDPFDYRLFRLAEYGS